MYYLQSKKGLDVWTLSDRWIIGFEVGNFCTTKVTTEPVSTNGQWKLFGITVPCSSCFLSSWTLWIGVDVPLPSRQDSQWHPISWLSGLGIFLMCNIDLEYFECFRDGNGFRKCYLAGDHKYKVIPFSE